MKACRSEIHNENGPERHKIALTDSIGNIVALETLEADISNLASMVSSSIHLHALSTGAVISCMPEGV